MSRSEAIEQYHAALRSGQKYYNDCVARNEDPYPVVLESTAAEAAANARVLLGEMEIPMGAIVGTLADGRKKAFAGNFMPLLEDSTEFAGKWISLCEAHLGAAGITDPISVFEYLGQFYVQEGHKRVSVLRSYGAPTIRAKVTRVIPPRSDDPDIAAYYEFLDFYKRSGVYGLRFRQPGRWAQLEERLGHEPGHVWTEQERKDFRNLLWMAEEAVTPEILAQAKDHSLSEVLLACLDVYPNEQLKALDKAALRRHMEGILPDLRYAVAGEKKESSVEVSTEPKIPGKSLVGRIIEGITKPVLNVAFVHINDPKDSVWSRSHDEGRRAMEEALGSQVRVRTYIVGEEDADTLMERAVAEGAQLIFATAPTLLGPARQAAALHHGLKVLVCALSVPYVGVRTYYSRLHEVKFISGAIAGALCGDRPLGYVARYPILGVPASVNAFALGVRMTNPRAKVLLDWSCLAGNPVERLRAAGARIISGHPIAAPKPSGLGLGWSTVLMNEAGHFLPLASDVWDWGRTYEQMARSVMAGAWDNEAPQGTSVNYWWGMSSGVIDIDVAAVVPEGVKHLANIFRKGVRDGSVDPFLGMVTDQQGKVRSTAEETFTPEELMRMNWLCDNVIGSIPAPDEVLPMSRETSKLLSLPLPDSEE